MKKKVFILSIVLMALFLIPGCRCNWEPVTEVTGITGVTAPPVPGDPDTLTFLYYADTRGDPFRPSSWNQKVHAKFIDKVLEHEKNHGIKYLLFGGDNVWLGFVSKAWEKFFVVMKKFEQQYQNIKIYPAIGNHELILASTILKRLQKKKAHRALTLDNLIQTLEKEHELDEPTPIFKEIGKVYDEAQEESLKLLKARKVKALFDTPWQRFKKYVDAWPHLTDIVREKKTYYSFTLPIGNTGKSAKIIVVDSNHIDETQKNWYKDELNFDEGPVITFCHHPIFYKEKSNGEDLFRHWNVPPHLFLVGHIHDYERRSLNIPGDKGPIHIVSGSGGAPLITGNKPHCCDKKTYQFKKWYNYCRVTINLKKISIVVFGCKNIDDPFEQIERLEFSWSETRER